MALANSARHSLLLAWLLILVMPAAEAIKCYSCANDFMVWQWRHFFLKRNYGLTASDASCVLPEVNTDVFQSCHSTCFVLFLNGTNKINGITRVLGVVRGCSSQYMTDDQHAHMGLGAHSKASEIGDYLPADFDQYDLDEHWCFCASDYCNTQVCYKTRVRFPSRRPNRNRDYDGFWRLGGASSLYFSSLASVLMLFVIVFGL